VQRPEVKSGFWGLGTGLVPGLHHPDMHFDLNSLPVGIKVFKACVQKVLG
jgi:amidohydrolase